jgi:hypothetical protein
MYFIGINVPFNCSMEDPVEDYILKENWIMTEICGMSSAGVFMMKLI